MLLFIIKTTLFLLLAGLILPVFGRSGGRGASGSSAFAARFLKWVSVVMLVSVGVKILLIQYAPDPRMVRLRAETDYYETILDRRANKGEILDRNGIVLAYDSLDAIGRPLRIHPHGQAFAHLVGMRFPRYRLYTGLVQSGLEDLLSERVSGVRNTAHWHGSLRPEGEDVRLTIASELQTRAFELLNGRRGAVVVMNPETGEILALVSSPSFDPDRIYRDDNLRNQDEFFRAIRGLYPPGSTFKTVVTAAAMEQGKMNFTIESVEEGYLGPGMHWPIRENRDHAYGWIGITEAYKKSSNQYFAALGVQELGEDVIHDMARDFGFLRTIPWNSSFDLWDIPESEYPNNGHEPLDPDQIASSCLGQYGVTATPLHMCMIAAAVGNEGWLMRPMLEAGRRPRRWRIALNWEYARQLKDMMLEVVGVDGETDGTAELAQVDGIRVGGKTGTAQVDGQRSHAWFIGIAPVGDPKIAIAVIVENAGYGGTYAAPIAREIIIEARNHGYLE